MFFWIFLICWKKILRKFLNLESTAYFLDQTFYHAHIPPFSITISTGTVIKATKYSTHYIIHNSYDVATKYFIIKKLVNLSYLVGSVDKNDVYFHMAGLLQKYCHCVIMHLSTRL